MSVKDDLRKKVLAALEEAPKPPKRRPCRLVLNNKYMMVLSGKHLWNNPGHAKTAFRNHVESVGQELMGQYLGGPYREAAYKAMKELATELIEDGTVKIVEVGQ
jgi:hypothetical protein